MSGSFTIDAFSVIVFDVPTSTLAKFSEGGALVDTLAVTDTIGIQPVVGVGVYDRDLSVLLAGAGGLVARVDLGTGTLYPLFDAAGSGFEALGTSSWYDHEVALGNYLSNEVHVYDLNGNLLRVIVLSTPAGITGLDLDLTSFAVVSYATSEIRHYHAYTGAFEDAHPTGLPPSSITGLGVDPRLLDLPLSARNWVVMGDGSDELARIDSHGTVDVRVPSGFTWINGLDVGDGNVPVELQGFTVE